MSGAETIVVMWMAYWIRSLVFFSCLKSIRIFIGPSGIGIISLTIATVAIQNGDFDSGQFIGNSTWMPPLLGFAFQGLILSLIIGLCLEAVPFAGRLIDTFRGAQLAEQFAPDLGLRDSTLEVFGALLSVLVAIKCNAHMVLIKCLLVSPSQAEKLALQPDFVKQMTQLATATIEVALVIILPLIVINIILELGFACFQKLYPKLHIGYEVGVFRSGVGIMFVLYLIGYSERVSDVLMVYLEKVYQIQQLYLLMA